MNHALRLGPAENGDVQQEIIPVAAYVGHGDVRRLDRVELAVENKLAEGHPIPFGPTGVTPVDLRLTLCGDDGGYAESKRAVLFDAQLGCRHANGHPITGGFFQFYNGLAVILKHAVAPGMDFPEIGHGHGAPGAGRLSVPVEGKRLAGLHAPSLLVEDAQRVHGHRVVPEAGGCLVEGHGPGQVAWHLIFAGAIHFREAESGVGIPGVDRLAKAVGQGLRAVGIGGLGQGRVNGQEQPGQAKPEAGCMVAKHCHAVRVSLATNGSSEKTPLGQAIKKGPSTDGP